MGSEKGLNKFFKSKEFTLLVILVVLVVLYTVLCALAGKSFFTVDTLMAIINSLVVTSFLAIGAACLLLTGKMDLSIVSIGCMGAFFFARAMSQWAWPWPAAFFVGLIICGILGIINAMLVNEFNMQPFIATMATATVFKGLFTYTSWDFVNKMAPSIVVKSPFTDWLGTYQLFGFIPITVILMLILFVVYGIMLKKTQFGAQVYLIGGNPLAARLSGLNPKRISYIMFANSGVLAGLAGIVFVARTGNANQLMLSNNMFTGLIAAVLGGISFFGGNGGMVGVFIGLCILNTFNTGMSILNFDTYWSGLLQGIVLVVALTLDLSGNKKLTKSVSRKIDSGPVKVAEKAGGGR
ncbi:MAG: ABC transporter permease [Clostridiales bacterium]|nr:ABC transporter permease [Clostridiales bacterium]